MIKRLLFILFSCFLAFPGRVAAQVDTTVVRDLSHHLYFYSGNGNYLPLIDKNYFEGRTIHFDIHVNDFLNNQLRIKSRQPVSVFINNDIVDILHGEKFYPLDSLKEQVLKEKLHFTLYSKDLNPFSISADIINIHAPVNKALVEEPVIIRMRELDPFKNFAIVAVLFLAGFLGVLLNYFPRSVSDFFRVSKAFSLRESDENLFKSRPISRINLLFYLFLSLLIALVLMLLVNHLELHFSTGMFYPEGFWDGLWKWGQLTVIIMCWVFVKYLLIYNLSALFYLRGFVAPHYFNYIRMTLFIFTAALVIIILCFYGFEITASGFYVNVFNSILFFLGIRVVILFFKLLSTASYQSLHLFSYLCGTEVIPFVILLYLGIDQPF